MLEFINTIYLSRPKVENDTVYFTWSITLDNLNLGNQIYVSYNGLNIENIPIEVHYNTIIGLLLNKLIKTEYKTIFLTEDTIPDDIVSFWISYHNIDNVFFPNIKNYTIRKSNTYSYKKSVGILYGGGKDSYYALDLLSKQSEIEKIQLISFVIPDSHVNPTQLEKRRDELILKPISEKYNIDYIKIKTNARALIKNYHLELYFAPLGVLAWLNYFDYLTFSYEYCHYFIPSESNEKFGFERSQHSHIQALSKFYSRFFSQKELNIFNANQHMSELSSFGYLQSVDKHFYKTLVMCESTVDPKQKWCCSCTKCAQFVLYSLFFKIPQNEVDIDWFFAESPYIKKIINQISLNEKKGLFFDGLTFHLHFDSFRFVITKLRRKNIIFNSEKARSNFNILVENYFDENIYREDIFYTDILKEIYPAKLYDGVTIELNRHLDSGISPKIKRDGNKSIYFNPNILPNIKRYQFRIQPNELYQKLVSANMPVQNIISAPYFTIIKNTHISNTKGLREQDISLTYNHKEFSIHFRKNPIMNADGIILNFDIELLPNYNFFIFKLNIPHSSDELEKRFNLEVGYNNSSDTIPLNIGKYLIKSFSISEESKELKKASITIKLNSKKNIEPWNWGNAIRIIVNNIALFKNKNEISEFFNGIRVL